MLIEFTKTFYNEIQHGKQKNLPDALAKELIKDGYAFKVEDKEVVKRTRKPKE